VAAAGVGYRRREPPAAGQVRSAAVAWWRRWAAVGHGAPDGRPVTGLRQYAYWHLLISADV